MSKKPQLPDYSRFLPEFTDKLQTVSDTYLDQYDEHAAFVYLTAELFETAHESKFTYSDGSYDGGIDFFIQDTQSYVIAQCKMPTLDTLLQDNKPPTFDKSSLLELTSAIDMLFDSSGNYELKDDIKRLRGDFQRA